MLCKKNIIFKLSCVLLSGCVFEGLISDKILNVLSKENESYVKDSVKQKHASLMGIISIKDVKKRNEELKDFFKKEFDTDKISKNLCGIVDDSVIDALADMLVRLYTTDSMIKILGDYKISENMNVITKQTSIQVNGVLESLDNKKSNIVVIFDNINSVAGKMLDIKVENISIIGLAKEQINSQSYKKSIKSIKDSKERAKEVANRLNNVKGDSSK